MRLKPFSEYITESAPLFPAALSGLAAEARKCPSFEEFRKDFLIQIKHGQYWHLTTDANFRIDPNKGPRDMSSLAGGSMTVGKLMITSDLDVWKNYYGKDRPYAALIDMSNVPRESYHQVSRGFGNEFIVNDPALARVVKVMSVASANTMAKKYNRLLADTISGDEDLKRFWERARSINI